MLAVLSQALWRRRVSLVWWALGLVAVAGLLAVAYPTVRDNAELDKTFAGLSPSVQVLLGLDQGLTLTSPAGYLNSQFFANLLPVMLLVFAVGAAGWSVAGDEAAGTLELLLANPVSRARVAGARAAALGLMLAGLTATCSAALVVMAPPAGLDQGLPALRMAQATAASGALALVFAAVAFAVGAATGSRPVALAVAAALAVAGYLIEGSLNRSTRSGRSGPPAPGTGCWAATRCNTAWSGRPGRFPLGSAFCWSCSAPSVSPAATCTEILDCGDAVLAVDLDAMASPATRHRSQRRSRLAPTGTVMQLTQGPRRQNRRTSGPRRICAAPG